MSKPRPSEEKPILEAIELLTHHSRAFRSTAPIPNSEIEDRARQVWLSRDVGREEAVLEIFAKMDRSAPSPVICSYAAIATNAAHRDPGAALSIAALGLAGTTEADHSRRSCLLNLIGLYLWFLTGRGETRIPTLLFEEAIRELPGGPDAWSPYVNLIELKLETAAADTVAEMADQVDRLFAKLHAAWDEQADEKDAWSKDETYVDYCMVNLGLEKYRSARDGSLYRERFKCILT